MTKHPQANRVDREDLTATPVRLAPDAGVLDREIAALAESYFGSIDTGDIDTMVGHLDPNGFDIHVLAPDAHLKSEDDYRAWYDRIVAEFKNLHHTVVALDPTLLSSTEAEVKLAIHSSIERRKPGANDAPRISGTVEIIWSLTRSEAGDWVITSQSENPETSEAYSTTRVREFAVNYLNNLDRRSLDSMLAVLAPQDELNIALNQGLIVEDFPAWFKMIDDAFINSVHRVQGLVALENADGTIDAHLKIHFTANQRTPAVGEDGAIDFSVERIWTLRRDDQGGPQLVSQRPFVEFDLSTRVDPVDIIGALVAVRMGETEVVRDWLRNGGDPNAYGPDGFNLFLAAAAIGNTEVLRMLLLEGVGTVPVDPTLSLKDPRRDGYDTQILAPHLSVQKGDVNGTLLLLSKSPDQLHARIEVNAHTPLLQAAFYGHVDVATAILENLAKILPEGADIEAEILRLFTETTLRGINATDFGHQFQNTAMIEALEPLDKSTADAKASDTMALLEAIPAGTNHPDADTPKQQASEAVFGIITSGLAEVATLAEKDRDAAKTRIVEGLKKAVQDPDFDANRLAGDLLQTPIIAAVTGVNANETVAQLRLDIVDVLIENGADPDKEEMYPMAVDAVIRAAVFNHFDALKRFEAAMTPETIKESLNYKPAINGLTALHDSVLRAATGSAGYLDQIRWARDIGASPYITDHTGRTQRDFATAAFVTEGQKENAPAVWDALQVGSPPPKPYNVMNYENLTFLTTPTTVSDKGTVWRTLAANSTTIVKGIELNGPNAMSAEVIQNHGFGTAIMDRNWPDGRLIDSKDVQAFAAQSRGTPLLPMMRFEKADPYIKQLVGAGLFGALFVNPDSSSAVRDMLRDVYFPQRPSADVEPRTSTAEFPLGKRAVGADNLAQRTFAEYPKMMDNVNTLFVGGLSFNAPAAAEVLRDLPALKKVGVRLIEIDHDGMRAEVAKTSAANEVEAKTQAAIATIEDAALAAGIVLSGRFSTDGEILRAFERGYRHVNVITENDALDAAWRSWLPAGTDLKDRTPLPREMPNLPPSSKINDVRRALADGELVVFGALTTPDVNNAIRMANSGILNAVAIEREHGTWSTDETVKHIEALRGQTNVMVRICSALDADVATFVEAGVSCLIATAVKDANEARYFLNAVEAANIATYGDKDKAKWAVPAVMMETEGAAADTDDIVAMLKEHEGVCHPGPLDLSASLGAAWGTDKYESTLSKIEETSKAANVPLAGVLNSLEESLAHGFGMVLAPVAMDAGGLNAGIMGTNPLESLKSTNSAK